MKPQHIKMSNQRQVSTFAIVLLMASLVIGVWLSAPTCYATDPAPPYNETATEERLDNIEKILAEMKDMIDDMMYGIWGTKGPPSRAVSEPPITPDPEPVTNETDVVIIVTDPLEELNLRIDFLSTNLHDLRMELSSLQSVDRAHKEEVEELVSKIDIIETTLDEQIEYLEDKVSGLQNTIVYVSIVTAVIVILGIVVVIRKGVTG